MSKVIVGVDLDGVLANFNAAYRRKLIAVTGRDLIPEGEEPPVWDYACPYYGYTRDEDKATWAAIIADPYFWFGLEAMPDAYGFLADVGHMDEVYFMTTRPGLDVKGQSEHWLFDSGANDGPTVLICRGEKGHLARGLGLTHFIDDKPENCLSVATISPATAVYLLACKYNEWAWKDPRYVEAGVRVVRSLDIFSEVLYADRDRAAVGV